MEDSLLLHIYVWLNKMTDVQDCCQRNGAYISFLETVCTFETATDTSYTLKYMPIREHTLGRC